MSTTVPVGSNAIPTTTSSATTTTGTGAIENKNTTTHSYSKLDEARAQASATMAHGRASAAQLSHHPQSMRCSNCAADMTIPASVWSWHCSQGHSNDINASFCSSTGCKEPKPNGVTWPAMLCSNCGTINSVPGSEGSAVVRDATASFKASLRSLTDRPATFHCQNCNTMLVTPIGQWQCQACTHTNLANTSLCSQCKQTRESQRVLCAHCHKSTNIPASGMSDSITSGLNSLTKMARSALLDISGKPHVDCPVCKHAVELPKSVALNNSSTTTTSTAGVAHVAQPASLPAATAQGIPLHEHGLALTCSHCNHNFILGGQSQARAPVGTGNVPAQLVNMPVAPIADPNDTSLSSQPSMPAKAMP